MNILSFSELVEKKPFLGRDAILTVGVFDGFHKGHQALVKEMVRLGGKYKDAEKILITFNVNPKTKTPKNVDTLRLREENAEKAGVNSFVIIDFSLDFSKISACGFIEMLCACMNPVAIVVGEDFRFGNPSESASATELKGLFLKYGVGAEVYIEKSILTEGGEKISSTLVRRVIENGEVECISSLTGRDYRVDLMPIPNRIESGELVISKSSIQQLLPPPGVYWARLAFRDGRTAGCRVNLDRENFVLADFDSPVKGEELESIYFWRKKMITGEQKKEIIEKFGGNTANTGDAKVQVALLTARINDLQGHFKANPKDHASRRGLLMLVGQRRRLLAYIKNRNIDEYRSLIAELGIRK